MATLAVAALSARALAEAAADAGHSVLALDLFGDADTCSSAVRWWSLGDGDSPGIAAGPLCSALRLAAAHYGAIGWIPGSGFEADPALLDAGAALLPLIGNPAAVWARVRDPQLFFGCLDTHGVPHPQVRREPPAAAEGWLLKDSTGCGGGRIRPVGARTAASAPVETLPASACYQRVMPGRPVSVTFIANGREAVVLGFNEQRVQAMADQPYVFAGVVGPVTLPAAADYGLRRALAVLVAEFGLRGLGSLDAMLDGDDIGVLELNPRPSASLSLYPRCGDQGVIDAHLRACLDGRVPLPPARRSAVGGQAIVYAPRTLQVDAALARRLAVWPGARDLPRPGSRVSAGDPLCSLDASGSDAASVHACLDAETERLLALLASLPGARGDGAATDPPR